MKVTESTFAVAVAWNATLEDGGQYGSQN